MNAPPFARELVAEVSAAGGSITTNGRALRLRWMIPSTEANRTTREQLGLQVLLNRKELYAILMRPPIE